MDKSELYQGHSIFRNQPAFTFFNKSFEDPNDPLFLQLNEIDPYFLSESQLPNRFEHSQHLIIDPRTQKEQLQFEYDHRDGSKKSQIFQIGIESSLSKEEQVSCLRVLLAWQEQKPVDENDFSVYRKLENKLIDERQEMKVRVTEYSEKHKDEIYAPSKSLDEYYRQWFRKKAAELLQLYPENLSFNTHTGLPHVNVCKSNNDEEKVDVTDVALLARKGWIRNLGETRPIDWKNLNFRLQDFFEDFLNSSLPKKENFKDKIMQELEQFEEAIIDKNFYIPFETLLFLLTSGDYVDLPTETFLEIRNGVRDEDKIIIFDCPLPARNCGWHTKQQMMERAFESFVKAEGRAKWTQVNDHNSTVEYLKTEETYAVRENGLFKPLDFEEYLDSCKPSSRAIRNNDALVKWNLKNLTTEKGLKILTTFSLPPCFDEKTEQFLAYESIKLEYKPQFGCEYMTKYELLKAWLQMRLMGFTATSKYGLCYRISIHNCDLQFQQHLTSEIVEHYLKQYYHINISNLLSNLAEFLKLLCNMPAGKFMLRFNPKYKDKFLFCAPSKEITQNTIFLHSLLEGEPTDLAFMTQQNFLPIDEMICSRVHCEHNILPCAFLPKLPHHKKRKVNPLKSKVMLEQILKPKVKVKKKERAKAKPNPLKRKRQRIRKRAEKKKLAEKDAEIEKHLNFC